MEQVYTPDFFRNLQLNSNNITSQNSEVVGKEYAYYNNYYFQVLIFDGDINNLDQQDFKLKLVYGKRKDLIKCFGLSDESLPTSGEKVKDGFIPLASGNKHLDVLNNAEYSTVRFLLQSRRLSQVTASTWLDNEEENSKSTNSKLNINQRKLTKKIFDTYNIKPNMCLLNNKLQIVPLEEHLNNVTNQEFLIKPDSISFKSISLALLLSGQAYYKDKDENGNDQYKIICSSIFSTYEMIWEYGIDLSWDTFYARREDISQSGGHPNPPFTKVVLAYPPRPHDFSLSQEQIRRWVEAKDEWVEDGEENQYPFYPKQYEDEDVTEQETKDWQNKQLKFIVPPYPYLPLSCL